MEKYGAVVHWKRGEQKFTDGKYSRAHEWQFDGGTVVPASSSPLSVPEPYSRAANVDPEEAVVAAASSCHMLWFLAIAAKKGFTIDDYQDHARGETAKGPDERAAFSRIVLHPVIRFSGDHIPTPEQLRDIHQEAHEACFVANSLKAEVVVEADEE